MPSERIGLIEQIACEGEKMFYNEDALLELLKSSEVGFCGYK